MDMTVRQLSRQTLQDKAYEILKEAIVSNELAPGQALSIEALAASLDTSPTPVREALIRLDADGLVVFEPHRRVRVAPLTEQAAIDAFEARRILEPWLAGEAARSVGSLPALRRSLELLRQAAEQLLDEEPESVNMGLFVNMDMKLQSALRRAVEDNKVIIDLLDYVGNRSYRIRMFVVPEPTELRIVHEHLAIIEHVLAGRVPQAIEATESHLRQAEERTLRAISRRLEAQTRTPALNPRIPLHPQARGGSRSPRNEAASPHSTRAGS
jgi:DNA-binding GntR family transcriptional regulator